MARMCRHTTAHKPVLCGPRRSACVRRQDAGVCRAKLITKSDIPAFIVRGDLMSQMNRWAQLEIESDGVTNFGLACSVEYHEREDEPWGFTVNMERVRISSPIDELSLRYDRKECLDHCLDELT
jgi:hypothetical protein